MVLGGGTTGGFFLLSGHIIFLNLLLLCTEEKPVETTTGCSLLLSIVIRRPESIPQVFHNQITIPTFTPHLFSLSPSSPSPLLACTHTFPGSTWRTLPRGPHLEDPTWRALPGEPHLEDPT